MGDREKVIKGLEVILEETADMFYRSIIQDALALLKAQNQKCRECGEATSKAIQELQAKLKAQEPRVMTLEEYEAWIDTPFTERNPVFHEERTKRGTVTCWVNTVVCTLREYGKNDRCWTSRPDEKRRAETPWQQ